MAAYGDMPAEHLTLETSDAEKLQARWDLPQDPALAVVFCHPHPQQGGTMTAPLMQGLTKLLVEAGIAVLRFNFRGVGRSSGTWGGGLEEIHDVSAAVDHALGRHLPLSIAGWSFGAAASLRWQAAHRSHLTWVGIAPPVPPKYELSMPEAKDLEQARRTVIMGNRDQLIDVDDARTYAAALGAEFHLITGSDHFFHFREDRVAQLMIPALSLSS